MPLADAAAGVVLWKSWWASLDPVVGGLFVPDAAVVAVVAVAIIDVLVEEPATSMPLADAAAGVVLWKSWRASLARGLV
eukprot:299944-Amphidinium_carterae.1